MTKAFTVYDINKLCFNKKKYYEENNIRLTNKHEYFNSTENKNQDLKSNIKNKEVCFF